MKKNIYILLFIILSVRTSFTVNQTGKNLAAGYGYVAGVENINAVTVNPANLYRLNYSEVMVSLNKPFVFHSLLVGIPFIYDKVLGLAVINNYDFYQYRAGANIIDIDILKFGLTLGADREIFPGKKDKWGFAFSPGLTADIINDNKNNFSLAAGVHYNNLYTLNKFEIYKELTKNDINFGLCSELFINSLFLNIGGNYIKEFDFNGSLEYTFIDSLKFIIMAGENGYGLGSEFGIDVHEITLATRCDEKIKSFNYSLSYKVRVGKAIRQIRVIQRERQHGNILNRQKELLDQGLELYKQKNYKEARDIWRKCSQMDYTTDYAKQARQYIIKVNNILETLGEE